MNNKMSSTKYLVLFTLINFILLISGCTLLKIVSNNERQKILNAKKELEKMEEALKRLDFKEIQHMDRDWRNYIERRIKNEGVLNYIWRYSDVLIPVEDPKNTIVTSEYGMRKINKRWEFHYGVDLLPVFNCKVISPITGKITRIFYSKVYGLTVRIKNEKYYVTLAHLECINESLKVGSDVNAGDFIGYAGDTGETTGWHLHFSISTLDMDGETWLSDNPFRSSIKRNFLDLSRHQNAF